MRRSARSRWVVLACVLLALAALVVAPTNASAVPAPDYANSRYTVGAFHPTIFPPIRIFDTTKKAVGQPGPIAPHQEAVAHADAVGGVPVYGNEALAVIVNVLHATASGSLAVYEIGAPGTVTVRFAAGHSASGDTIVGIDPQGTFRIYNNSPAPLNVTVDVVGWVDPGVGSLHGSLHAMDPTRIINIGALGYADKSPIPAFGSLTFQIASPIGFYIPTTAAAAALQVSVLTPRSSGALAAYPTGPPRPPGAAVRFKAGQSAVGFTIVRVGSGGRVTFYNSSPAPVRIAVDLVGWIDGGTPAAQGLFGTVPAARLFDSAAVMQGGKLGAGAAVDIQVGGRDGVPTDAESALLQLSVIAPTTGGGLTVAAGGGLASSARRVTFLAGADSAGGVVTRLGGFSHVIVKNESTRAVRVIVEVLGYTLPDRPRSPLLSWSAPTTVTAQGLQDVSCATTTFCYAVGGTSRGLVSRFNGTSWSAANAITPLGATARLTSVSCVSTSFCVAVGTSAGVSVAYLYNGVSWSDAGALPAGIVNPSAVSCVTTTFCMVAGHSSARFDGTSWTAAPLDERFGPVNLTDVSCATTTSCLGATPTGEAPSWDGSTWSFALHVGVFAGQLMSVNCTTAAFCTAVDHNGIVSQRVGSTWTSPVYGVNEALYGVSCVTASFCAVLGNGLGESAVLTWDGIYWTRLVVGVTGDLQAISCPTTTTCVAVTAGGQAILGSS